MNKIDIGAHTSASGGCYMALENAHSLGVVSLQMFGSSPKQYNVRFPKEEDVEKFKNLYKEYGIKDVFLHSPYLVNLASPKGFVRHQSREALAGHLKIANILEARGVIFHIGSVGVGGDKDEGIEKVIKGIEKVYDSDEYNKSVIIIENGSGGGGKIGSNIDEMARIVNGVKNGEVGVCLDTAHIFASGVLDFTDEGLKKFFDEWNDKMKKYALKVLHINDSKSDFNSFVDRHENIGEGKIGKSGFEKLAKYDLVRDVPWILEVPGFAGEGPDKENIDILDKIVN